MPNKNPVQIETLTEEITEIDISSDEQSLWEPGINQDALVDNPVIWKIMSSEWRKFYQYSFVYSHKIWIHKKIGTWTVKWHTYLKKMGKLFVSYFGI